MFERYDTRTVSKPIPVTGNNYFVSVTGEVTTKDGTILPHSIDKNGHAIVKIRMWAGLQYYKVALLVSLAFKNIRLPYHLWSQLDVLFADQDKTNFHPRNLVWKFPEGGLIHLDFHDYAYIPCFSQYVINRTGDIMHAKSGKIINFHYDTGYARYKLTPDIGQVTSVGRHRLICLAWLTYPENVDSLVINHINNIPGDDRLENLEWVTRARNNIHAITMGVRLKNPIIQMRNVVTKEEMEFIGFRHCAEYLGLSKDTIKFRVYAKNQPVYPGFLQFKLKSDKSPWREVDDPKDRKLHVGEARPVKARNIITNEVKLFNSVAECAHEIGCRPTTIHGQLSGNRKHPRPMWGHDFKWHTDRSDWNVYTEHEIKMYTHNPTGRNTGIIVTNIETGEEKFFPDQNLASEYMRVKTGMIKHALKNNSKIKRRFLVRKV